MMDQKRRGGKRGWGNEREWKNQERVGGKEAGEGKNCGIEEKNRMCKDVGGE